VTEPLVPCPRCEAQTQTACFLCSEVDKERSKARGVVCQLREQREPIPAGLALQYKLLEVDDHADRRKTIALRKRYFSHG